MLKVLLTLGFSWATLFPLTAGAQLSKSDRDELFERVDYMCRDASSVGSVLSFEGSLDAGAILKVVGINAAGKVTKEQWSNIEQKYGEFRSNPTICRFEMIKLIEPLFGKAQGLTAPIFNVAAASGRLYSVAPKGVSHGSRVWSDRQAVFSVVPDFLAGSPYIITACDDKFQKGDGFLSFRLNREGDVYVAYDVRYHYIPDWLQSFQETSDHVAFTFGNENYPMRLYRKHFGAGSVELGGPYPDNERGNYSMYSVFVKL
jgi:hypothetical protein